MSVSCECCVLSGRGLCVGLTFVQRSPTECGVSECDHESSIIRWPWPTGGCSAMVKTKREFKDGLEVTHCQSSSHHHNHDHHAMVLMSNLLNIEKLV